MNAVDVRDRGLVGSLCTPGGSARPGVLVLGGSEGGLPTDLARRLAAKGFTCLGLAYFRLPGLPRRLAEIPLEYVETALTWLVEHPATAGSRVGVIGASKGAELTLLAAATFPDVIGAAVAYAPSSVVFAGIGVRGGGMQRSSWSHHGQPVPFVPYRRMWPSVSLHGFAVGPIYEDALENVAAAEAAAIPIERTRAPVLLVSGDQDRMWPASRMAEMVTTRLADAGRADQVVHLRYPKAGHGLVPWDGDFRSRIGALLYDFGGRVEDNREAISDAWPKVASFLRDNLQ